MKRQRLLSTTFLLILATLPAAAGDRIDDEAAYRLSVESVVWVSSFGKDDTLVFGTGVLIDVERHYVLTANHVVAHKDVALVAFPARDGSGEIIGTADFYRDETNKAASPAVVVDRDPAHDLALLKVDVVPLTARAMPIAVQSARPGESVFAIGNDFPGPLWRFAGGSVRQVYRNSFQPKGLDKVEARMVDMSVPLNHGDSGGPLIGRRGELLGINAAIAAGNQNHRAIDIGEVWNFLRRRDVSVTLFDPASSASEGGTIRNGYAVFFTPGGSRTSTVTHRYSVTNDAAGQVTVSAVTAVPPATK